jgi:hypothetical protein
MLTSRREPTGFTFNRYARIQAESNGPTRDCLIVSLSDRMVRLHCDIAEVLNEFTLTIPEAKRQRRSCRVIWRLGFEVGAQFNDAERGALRNLQRASAA